MARPIKDGVSYWPFDVDMLDDDKFKLIRAEFGIKGAYVALFILNSVYKDKGYYKRWDEDSCYLTSEGVGDGCSPQLVDEILAGCVRRGLFDQGLFQMFGILTSAGIQRRFFNIVKNSRDKIVLVKEYLLFDLNEQTVSEGVLNKVVLKTVSPLGNASKTEGNPDNFQGNSQKKSKEKKKERDIKTHSSASASAGVNYQEIINSFNRICTDLPKVRDLTDARRQAICKAAERLKNEGGFDVFFEKVHRSDFLCGRTGAWKCGFDWILKPANMTKIREGNYDNRLDAKKAGGGSDRTSDDILDQVFKNHVPKYVKKEKKNGSTADKSDRSSK